MAVKIENTPSPDVLMNSMRSIGYNFKTALADIIDNSISANAKNIYISTPINNDEMFISILDDGFGMDDNELFNAMKYGSGRDNYGEKDLGRFGLGLKSASLSQCRILTVASMKNGKINAYQWNLDDVVLEKRWDCLKLDDEEINKIPNINSLKDLNQGTLVVWENFDIGFKKNNGKVREYLCDEMDDAELHLRLVFHRFLNNQFHPIKMYINNFQLNGLDPFLENHAKTDTKNPSEIKIDDSLVKIQSYILPHQNDLSSNDIDNLGGIEYLKNGQGFYIYRNERLLIYGTWFRLSSSNISSELYKYGRIKVDIPNTLDEMWEIDIKKQNAVIPNRLLNNLKKVVNTVCRSSTEKTSRRTKLTLEKDDKRIWNKILSKENKERFYINNESNFVRDFLDEFEDKDKKKILHFLDVISSSVPYDDIYNAMCNKKAEQNIDEDQFNSIILIGIDQYHRYKKITQLPKEQILEILCKFEPFNNENIKARIEEALKDEK